MLHLTLRRFSAPLRLLTLIAFCLNSFAPAMVARSLRRIGRMAPTATSAQYTITDLGTLGGTPTVPQAINSSGQVTGQSTLSNETGQYHAFLYSNGQIKDLLTLGGTYSSGYAVNSAGQVTGFAYIVVETPHAFLYNNGQMQDLGTFGGRSSWGTAINSSGQVTGYADLSGSQAQHAFLYSDGHMQDLGTLGGSSSGGTAINPLGQVTGGAQTSGGDSHAFLYNNGQMQDLLTLGGRSSSGDAINSVGQVAGISDTSEGTRHVFLYSDGHMQDITPDFGSFIGPGLAMNEAGQVTGTMSVSGSPEHAFLYSNGHTQDLGTLGGTISSGEAINSSGQVVGGATLTSGPVVGHAFVYDTSNGMRDLNNLIPENSGWILLSATAINDNGQIIGGGMINGEPHAFLLTPRVRPLIFIPGIAGSYLVDTLDGETLWPHVHGNSLLDQIADIPNGFGRLNRLSLKNPPFMNTIVATDAIRQDPVAGDVYGTLLEKLKRPATGYEEYDLSLLGPDKRPGVGCDLNQKSKNPNLFVFPYDWRFGIEVNAGKLKSYIQCIQQFWPDSKVNILAHSTGGLMARRYLLDNPPIAGHPGTVNKLVTIAAPYVGAPKAINSYFTGQFLDDGGKADFIFSGTLKPLIPYFNGAADLLPTNAYMFDLGGRPFIEEGFDLDKNGIPNYRIPSETYDDYNQLVRMLNLQFGDHTLGLTGPGRVNGDFHTMQQDYWSIYDPDPDVTYFHIVGVQKHFETIRNVKVTKAVVCNIGGCLEYGVVDLQMTAGDGTVPLLSASRILVGQANLNDPNAIVQPVRFTTPNPGDGGNSYNHVTMTANPEVIDLVFKDLDATSSTSSATLDQHNTTAVAESLAEMSPANYLKLFGNANITVADDVGHVAAPMDISKFGSTVPGVTFNLLGENSLMMVMDASQSFTVTFPSSGKPIKVEFTQGTDQITTAARFQDVTIPAGSVAMIRVTPTGVDRIKVDTQGNGNFSEVITPTATATGVAAQDAEPPSVVISGTTQGSSVLVDVTATDASSGLKSVSFSLDGTHYQKYTGAISVYPNQSPVFYAFADDNLANRSAVVTFYPSLSGNSVDNAQFFVRQHYADFLNREPDAGGLSFWTTQITSCGSDPQCIEFKRINVSAAYFLSIEFQETGYLVYRMYKAAYGNLPGAPVPVRFNEFLPDTQQIGNGVQVGIGDWQTQLENNKVAFALDFVSRSRFATVYPTTLTPAEFVDALFANAGVAVSTAERTAAINEFGGAGNTADTAARARALRRVAENSTLKQRELNKAFVLMQYFGYLRRNPNDPPEAGLDFAGYNFWLGKLNQFNGNFVQAELVKAFISSTEYRQRFGP